MIDSSVLKKARALPLKPADIELRGEFVRLRPLDLDRDVEALFRLSNGSEIQPTVPGLHASGMYDPDELIWRYMSQGPFADASQLSSFLSAQVNAKNGLCLSVFTSDTTQVLGVFNYMNNFPEHLKIELGNIWYSPIAQRTPCNTEATYLALRHAFDLGYRRVEWKCDANNDRSRRAALRMGFKFEGIQEQHFIVKALNRDTAWYRILDREWPSVREHLEQRLYGAGSSTSHGSSPPVNRRPKVDV